jgi:hypothetical protein
MRLAGRVQYAGLDSEAVIAYALARSGRPDEARAIVARLEARARGSYARPADMAAAYLGLGDTARALHWVERIPDDRGSILFLMTESIFDPVRRTPRFRRVIEQLGLDDTAK